MSRRCNIAVILLCVVFLTGCKLSITSFIAPDVGETGTVITLNVSGAAKDTGDGASEHAVVIQIPSGWSVLYGKFGSGGNFLQKLTPNDELAALYAPEAEYSVWAGSVSGQGFSGNHDVTFTIRVLVGSFSGNDGDSREYNLKSVLAVNRDGQWDTDDPENIFDFSMITDDKYVEIITVTKVSDTVAPDPVDTLAVANYYRTETAAAYLSWDGYDEEGQGDVVAYRVYRDTKSFNDVSGMVPIAKVSIGSFYYYDDGLVSGNTYYYAVTAIDEMGHENSSVTSASVVAQPPGSISGIIYQTDGVTPIKSMALSIECSTSLCGYTTSWGGGSSDGTYQIKYLAPGNYYITASLDGVYFSEWWSTPKSVRDCSNAQAITVVSGQNSPNHDFQLDPFVAGPITVRVATGNFYGDIAKEFAVATLRSDNSLGLVFYDNSGAQIGSVYPINRFKEISLASGNFNTDSLDEVVLAGVTGDGGLLILIYNASGELLSAATGGVCSNVKVAKGRFNTSSLQDEFAVTLLQSDGTLAVITYNYDGTRIGKGVGGKCSNLGIAAGNFDSNDNDDEYVVSLLQADGTLAAITYQGDGTRIGKGVGGKCSNVSVAAGKFCSNTTKEQDGVVSDQYVVSLLQADGTLAAITYKADGTRIGKGVGGLCTNVSVAAGTFAATTPLDGYAVSLKQSNGTPATIFYKADGARIGKGAATETATSIALGCGDINGDGWDEAVMGYVNTSGTTRWMVIAENGTTLLSGP